MLYGESPSISRKLGLERPRLSIGYPYIVTAVVIHGVYNAGAVLLEVTEVAF